MTSGPGLAFASWIAARRLQSPFAVTHFPLPMLESVWSFVVFTTIGAPSADVTAAWVVKARVTGAAALCTEEPATAWRSATSRQPSPLGSAWRSVLQTPNRRASLQDDASVLTSIDETAPLPSTSKAAPSAADASAGRL